MTGRNSFCNSLFALYSAKIHREIVATYGKKSIDTKKMFRTLMFNFLGRANFNLNETGYGCLVLTMTKTNIT